MMNTHNKDIAPTHHRRTCKRTILGLKPSDLLQAKKFHDIQYFKHFSAFSNPKNTTCKYFLLVVLFIIKFMAKLLSPVYLDLRFYCMYI